MPDVRRQFRAVSADGREFNILEFASFRWERNAAGERCQVENDGRDFYTTGGDLVVPTEQPFQFRIVQSGMVLRETDEGAALDSTHCDSETLHDDDRATGV